ncbi:unnamed protein product, partial [marine sediment metagenome]
PRPRVGGGGGGAAPAAPSGVTDVSTTAEGEVTASVTATSPDGKATVTIPAGTKALDADGNPLTQVTVIPPSALPAAVPPGVGYVGYACNFGPTGATFDPAVAISVEFDPADFPEGTTPVIYVYEAGAWMALDTTVVGNKATAYVDHFSTFVLFAAEEVTPTPTPVVTPTATPAEVTPTPTPTPPIPRIRMAIVIVVVVAIVAAAIIVAVAFVPRMRRRKKS